MIAKWIAAFLIVFAHQADAHSAGLNKQGCHADSQPFVFHTMRTSYKSVAY